MAAERDRQAKRESAARSAAEQTFAAAADQGLGHVAGPEQAISA